MPTNAKKIRIGGVSHDIEDTQARTDISELKSSINSSIGETLITDFTRADSWYIRPVGTIGFAQGYTGAYHLCKANTKYILRNTGTAAPIGIGCSDANLALNIQLNPYKTGTTTDDLEITTGENTTRLFYYIGNSNFSDLSLYEVGVVDTYAREEIADFKETVNELETTKDVVYAPITFEYSTSGTKTALIELKQGKTYIVQNTLDSLSNVTARSLNGSTQIDVIANPFNIGTIVEYTPSANADRISFYCASAGAKIIIYEKNGIYGITNNTRTPFSKFKYSETLKDVSTENAKMLWTGDNLFNVLPQVYSLFDALVTDYPSYVSKVDAATEMSMTYPAYANGVETEGEYKVTPAYKTYMYKLIDTNTYAGNGGNVPKKKVLLLGCMHGNEVASAFNCYLFAHQLCTNSADNDIFELRSCYDFYIVPCVDGYGMYHRIRGNGNLVNLERNFPVKNWVVSGAGTKTDVVDALNQYSGPSAGSEFETQLVMALVNSIKPNVFVDHHNYGHEKAWQFYCEACESELINPMYQSLIDCSHAFKTGLPSYFGSGFGLLINANGSFPQDVPNIGNNAGYSYRWMRQQGYKCALISEIGWCINYLNGSISQEEQDKFGDDTFSIGLYTLENMLKHLCEYENKLL